MSTTKPPRGLGRGLDVLLPATRPSSAPSGSAPAAADSNVFTCPIDKIVPQRGMRSLLLMADAGRVDADRYRRSLDG